MKDGVCPKCGSDEVYQEKRELDQRSRKVLTIFSHVRLLEFICCNCGLVETYLADLKDVKKVKAKCMKVKASA